MAAPRIRINTREFGQVLVEQAGPVQDEIAEDIASRARSSAPEDTGEYRSKIDVHSDIWHKGPLSFRRSRVVAQAPHSLVVESKTGNLKRALGGA